jgi:hypothetical protein
MVPQAHTPNRLERSLLLSKALLCRRVHRRPFRLSPHKPKLLASFRAHNAALNMDLPFWAREGSVLNGIRRKLVNNERKVLSRRMAMRALVFLFALRRWMQLVLLFTQYRERPQR